MENVKFYVFACILFALVRWTSQLEIGDSCLLKDGTKGTCRKDRDCAFVIDLIRANKHHEIVSCRSFHGRSQIVCCKEKFSQRFSTNVLCDGKVEKRPSKPVRFEDHIVNGEEAEIAEFPHIAAMGYKHTKGVNFRCGGTLISEYFVLTAAHCCNKKGDQPIMVRLGKTSLHDGSDNEIGQDIDVKKVIVHERFSSTNKTNDIALLQLQSPAVMAYNVWPACLSSVPQGLVKNLRISGFGVKNTDDRSTSMWLLKGKVDEVNIASCQKKFSEIPNISTPSISSKQVCAHNPTKFTDTCQGDSGGPLEYSKNNQPYVYGITSFGLGCGSPEIPSVYTRVDEYIDWIYQKMEI